MTKYSVPQASEELGAAVRPALPGALRLAAEDEANPADLRAEAGAVFGAPYPFIRETFKPADPDEPERMTWRPGVRNELVPPDDCECVADARGKIVLTVVSVHRPAHYPTRVFFTRQWEDPEGCRFGKAGLRIVTLEKFRRLARGYAHEYRLADAPQRVARPSALAIARRDFADALGVPESVVANMIARGGVTGTAETALAGSVRSEATNSTRSPAGDAPAQGDGG